jgi:predicted nucleic acid-binding protein
MVCVDTTCVADLIRKNPDANKKMSTFAEEGISLSTTIIINAAGLFYGAYKSNSIDREKEKLRMVLSSFIVFEMDQVGAEKFGEILRKLDKAGQKTADRDVMTAAIALSKGETVIVTRNRKDFDKISSLKIAAY